MTNWILKRFVRDGSPQDPVVRQRYGVVAGMVGIVCNAVLFALKLLVGTATRSISITADAFNNLSDGLSSVISIAGFKLAGKAPDSKHPFGYGRTEYLAGFAVAFLILLVGIEFLKTSFDRILHPAPVAFHGPLLALLAASLLIKLWLGAFNRTVGRRIESPTLLAAMQDSINDVITTSVVLAGMVAGQFTTLPVDGYIGVLVALFILWSGFGIAKDTLSPLIGQAADPEIARSIEKLVTSMEGIVGVHDLIVHNYGAGRSLASLHAEVPSDADFVTIHEVVDEAEKLVWQKTGVYLVIHMDPIATNDARIIRLREQVEQIIGAIDKRLSMHDFRVVDGKRQINLVFDVVVPYGYDKDGHQALMDQITAALRALDGRYHPVVTFDHQM